jgi:hypothetical protein
MAGKQRMALRFRAILSSFLRAEGGQAALEYLLATAAFSAAIAFIFIAIAQLAVPEVLQSLCGTVDPLGDNDCLTIL